MSILHAIVMHKPVISSKEEALTLARHMFPNESIKGFVRETEGSYRVRVVPKTKFDHTTFRSKKINKFITLVFGNKL
jgi:hypothetical protein